MAYGLLTQTNAGGRLGDTDESMREDLIDIITDVSPDENPLSTMLARTTASQPLHQWQEDYISRPSSVSTAVEGAAATYADLVQPIRRTNWTHIVATTFRVSGTESAVEHAGMGDPYDYQAAKALTNWKNNQEYALVNGTLASGSSGVARQMAGLDSVITSHYTARNSGTSLSETEFNDMVKESWTDVGNSDVFDMVLVPFALKQKISQFTAGSTKFTYAEDKRLTRPVSVYESDGGVHRIMAHKDVISAAATPGPRFIGIKEDKFRIAYLRNPKREELAKDGDRRNGQIVGEFTLEFLAERTSVRRTGYNQSG
jgi:uncharacterized protein YceK